VLALERTIEALKGIDINQEGKLSGGNIQNALHFIGVRFYQFKLSFGGKLYFTRSC
jgi:hypothetical protein